MRIGLLGLVYILVGAFVAGTHDYFQEVNGIADVISALLAIFLWPLVLLDVSLRLG
jgi:hypothetical protein